MFKKSLNYKKAGVDIDAASQSVEMIKKWVNSTKRAEVLSDIGSFGGLFALDSSKYREPVLVSGADGVGTKLRIAQILGVHDTVGIDLVAMCVNDILASGAEPLFFLDYIALGKLDPPLVELLVKGVSDGCRQAGCALIGGETAEMPGFYTEDEYDLAGFAVGVVEKEEIITGEKIQKGDILIGLPSSGLHSNGYSLVRKIFPPTRYRFSDYYEELKKTLGEELLLPTRIYVDSILDLIKNVKVKGLANITGGGIVENLARILPAGLGASIDEKAMPDASIFKMIMELGNVNQQEMYRTFNMGIGYIAVVDELYQDKAVKRLIQKGECPIIIGRVDEQAGGVKIQ
ncbi:MAG: phosphoribosylformylglycinamidine cyclo-ligase [Syntrophomonadaceae bacterium]|jgi:phosphoribosylformylglycinamidine cyclo-ligase|nr:phosphoribosylformylglycinamidine cyclo-ligase [Syntrophomonadaceae bacterium]